MDCADVRKTLFASLCLQPPCWQVVTNDQWCLGSLQFTNPLWVPGARVHAGRGRLHGLPNGGICKLSLNVTIGHFPGWWVLAYTQGKGGKTAYLAELFS